jgi:peptidoglycan/xylan/chitin deacetylase (PgdA/CDA1 family)
MMHRRTKLIIAVLIILVAAAIGTRVFFASIYRFPVLMYHSIDYATDKKDRMVVSPEAFDRQMKFLRDHKYNVVTVDEAVAYIGQKKTPPARTVAITMDDGYEDNYKYAYPILKKYRIPVTIFVIVDKIGADDFLNWKEIKEMSASGIIDIESHTMSHPFLTGIDDKKLAEEMALSKRTLEKELGRNIKFICYPMGVYNEHVKSMARQAGYEAGFATKPTRLAPNYDAYEIKRVRISPTANNLFVFWIKLSGYHSFYKVVHDDYKGMPSVK